MKYLYQNVKAAAKIYKPYLYFFISFSLLSLSCSFLRLSLYSSTLLTSLHTLLTIFNTPCVSNMLQTVRFHSLSHTWHTKHSQKTWMTCRSYFIVLTVHTCDVQNIHRLPYEGKLWHCAKLTTDQKFAKFSSSKFLHIYRVSHEYRTNWLEDIS